MRSLIRAREHGFPCVWRNII